MIPGALQSRRLYRTFVRYCGQGSSLLWTPVPRPFVGPML